MNITAFPNDLFLLVIEYLSPSDLIRVQRVSRDFYAAFTNQDLSRHVLKRHYPRVRELREVSHEKEMDWPLTFATVASRYHHLKAGKPREVEKLRLGKSFVVPKWSRNYPVSSWNQHLHFEEKTAPFHYPDTLWTYDEGILIFPSAELQTYALYDLQSCTLGAVALGAEGMIVRRIRLKEKVLIVEWCEEEAYHQLNENEMVYRHFSTAYDLLRGTDKWNVVFRNEWKIHFLGLPLNSSDRFLSSHSASHYALYLWQPNRSAWGEDDPIEALTIWDISSSSCYRPSKDPTGALRPSADSEGPRVIKRLSFTDLDFYQIRQRSTPILRSLELDANHVYFIEEDHRWLVGQEASYILPRLHKVKSTGIPFFAGPRWIDQCGADGDSTISFCVRSGDSRCPTLAPCWRHEEFPYLTITETLDIEAGVKFSARHCFMLETIAISLKPKVDMAGPDYEVSLRDDFWPQLLGKGKVCGDERWLIGENTDSEIVILHFNSKQRI